MFYSTLCFLAVLQVVFLPGFVLFTFFKKKIFSFKEDKSLYSLGEKVIFSFIFSLLFNYLLVFFLVGLGIYSNKILYCLFVIEILLLIKIFLSSKEERTSIFVLIFFFAITIFGIMLFLFITKQNVFFGDDELSSWNHWALKWTNNIIPTNTRHYPQLVPIIWSVLYKFTNNSTLHYSAKILMPFFLIFIVLLKINFFLKFRNYYYLLSIFLTSFFLLTFNGIGFVFTGVVDTACCFFYFLFTYLVTICYHEKENKKIKFYFYLTTLSVCTAAVVKQGNLFLIIPYLFFFLLVKKKSFFSVFLILIIGLLIIVLPWYFIAELNIMAGLNSYDRAESWIKLEKPFYYEGRSYFENFIHSLKMLKNKVFYNNNLFTFISIIALLVSIFYKKLNRFFFLVMILPFSILWALFVSYEIRNYIHIVAVLYLIISHGLGIIFFKMTSYLRISQLQILKEKFKNKIISFAEIVAFLKNKTLYKIIIPTTITGIFLINFIFLKENKIDEKQTKNLLIKLGKNSSPVVTEYVNTTIYQKFKNTNGKILTNYPKLIYNPIFVINKKNKITYSDSKNILEKYQEKLYDYIVLVEFSKENSYHNFFMSEIEKGKIKIIDYNKKEKFILCSHNKRGNK